MSGVPAVFLDRDGTIIEDRGTIGRVDDVRFFADTIPSLKRLDGKFMLFIVTHQPGVARGEVTRDQVDEVNGHVMEVLRTAGVDIIETYVCPHERSEGCVCVKPNPYFLLRAAEKYDLDLERSYTVGDHPPDVQLAANAGATGIYLLSGHGEHHRHELDGDVIVVRGIKEAVERILELSGSS